MLLKQLGHHNMAHNNAHLGQLEMDTKQKHINSLVKLELGNKTGFCIVLDHFRKTWNMLFTCFLTENINKVERVG